MNVRPLNNSETAAFCSQMAVILTAGMSPYEGLSLMIEDALNKEDREILEAINVRLLETGSLYTAIADTGVFPAYMVSMLQIGERTGHVDDVMQSLSDYYEKEAGLTVTIRNALTYPFIMILAMIAVVIVLLTKVLPIFDQVFRQLGTEMGGLSRALLTFGNFLNNHIYIPIALIVILLVLAVYLGKTKSGQASLAKLAGKFKITSIISDTVARYRFANGLALTLSSGLTPEDCLNYVGDVVDDKELNEKVAKCKESVAMGTGLGEALLENHVFSGLQARLINIANRAGALDEALKKIAAQYEAEIDNKINKIIASIEPTLVVVLSIIVGIILLSVMLPLINVMTVL